MRIIIRIAPLTIPQAPNPALTVSYAAAVGLTTLITFDLPIAAESTRELEIATLGFGLFIVHSLRREFR